MVTKVSELINDETRSWDRGKLKRCLNEDDANEVIKILLPQQHHEDIIAWHYHRKGIFTIRSAYFLEIQEDMDVGSSSLANHEALWRKVWTQNIPPVTKMFAWRALHNGLHLGKNLIRRKICSDTLCPRCGEET